MQLKLIAANLIFLLDREYNLILPSRAFNDSASAYLCFQRNWTKHLQQTAGAGVETIFQIDSLTILYFHISRDEKQILTHIKV